MAGHKPDERYLIREISGHRIEKEPSDKREPKRSREVDILANDREVQDKLGGPKARQNLEGV